MSAIPTRIVPLEATGEIWDPEPCPPFVLTQEGWLASSQDPQDPGSSSEEVGLRSASLKSSVVAGIL